MGLRAQSQQRVDDAYHLVHRIAGTDPNTGLSRVQIPRSPALEEVIEVMASESDRALFQGAAAGKNRLLARFAVREGDEITPLGPDGSPMNTIHREASSYDFNDVNSALSYLRRLGRQQRRAQDADLPGLRDIGRMKQALIEARNSHLAQHNPELLVAITEAEQARRLSARTFERGVIGDLLRQTDETMGMSNADVARRVFSTNNAEEAAEVATVLSGDAPTMRAAREQLMSFYRQQAADADGVISRQSHDRFMREYGETVRPFLSPDELSQIDELGNLARVVEDANARAVSMEDRFRRSVRGRVSRMNSEGIVEGIFGTGGRTRGGTSLDGEDVTRMVRFLGRTNPALLENVRVATRDEIRRRISDPVTGHLDFNRLNALIDRTADGMGTKLEALFGARYVNDLRLFRDAIRMQAREGTGRAIPMQGPSESMVGIIRRISIPPLTQRGRAATAVQQKLRRFGQDALYEIISDPAALRTMQQNLQAQIRAETTYTALAGTGMDVLIYLDQNGMLE
jgi:hypothetical protein